jgi:hypothetical protein
MTRAAAAALGADRVALGEQRRRERRGVQVAEPVSLDDDPREPRVQRQPRHRLAGLREAPATDGAEPREQVERRREARRFRRLEPRKRRHVLLSPREQFEHRARDVHAPHLGRQFVRERALLVPRPQAEGHSRRHAPRAAGALHDRRLRDPLEDDPVHADGGVVAHHARESRVDDGGDALDRHRRLRDVRREHDAAARALREGGVLPLGRQVAVELDDVDARAREVRDEGAGGPDLADARQEREHVAGRRRERCADRAGDLIGHPPRVGTLEVPHLDRVQESGRLDDLGIEERGDGAGVDRGRHRDDPQVGPRVALDAAAHGEREIRGQRALVELVEHDSADVLDERVVLKAAQQHAVGDGDDARPRSGLAVEPDDVTDLVTDADPALRRDPPRGRARRDAPRLEHHDLAGTGESGVEHRGRHARRLARTRRCAQHRVGAAAQHAGETRQRLVDGQRRGSVRVRHAGSVVGGAPRVALPKFVKNTASGWTPGEFQR